MGRIRPKHNNKPLKTENNNPAGDLDCCCFCVCNCGHLMDIWLTVVDQLYITLEYPAACGGTVYDFALNDGTSLETGCIAWRSTGLIMAEFPPVLFRVECNEEGASLYLTTTSPPDAFNCNYGSVVRLSFQCEPFEAVYEIDVIPGGADPPACPCDSDTITVTINE